MKAKDIMTANVISVGPDVGVHDVAQLLLARHISAVPVVDESSRLLGIVSEGDLMRRAEIGTERPRAWWLELIGWRSDEDRVKDYIHDHGHTAGEVMTGGVVTVTEDTDLGEIARLLERHRIKRVPVVRGRAVVGIVSRANRCRRWLPVTRARPRPMMRASRRRSMSSARRRDG